MAFNNQIDKSLVLVSALLMILLVPFTHQQAAECGQSMSTRSSRIAGGNEATPNEFPWMAHIQVNFWSGNAATCGGTLISPDHVLTAAHCLFGVVSAKITLGAHDVTLSDSTTTPSVNSHQIVDVTPSSFKSHPNWSYGQTENDIAVIQLPYPVYFNEFVQPACLPFAGDSDQVNDPVVLTGWGNFSVDSGSSPVLRRTDTTVISSNGTNGQCQQTAGVGSFSGDKIICSDGSQGRRFCYGDDGGPMNYYNAEWDRWFVLGVAGNSSYECSLTSKPNVFVRVRGYLDWIGGITGLKPITTTSTTTTTTTTTTTPTTTRDPFAFDCKGKPDGNYPNPTSTCSKTFYMCSNGNAYLFTCAQAGTVYRPDISACDWPSNVAGCN